MGGAACVVATAMDGAGAADEATDIAAGALADNELSATRVALSAS